MRTRFRLSAVLRLAPILVALFVYGFSAYGGIRSPDAEIMYRTGVSLAERGEFAVPGGLEVWPGFGLERGLDGRLYPVFGPLQSLFIGLTLKVVQGSGLDKALLRGERIPPSHYHRDNLLVVLNNKAMADRLGAAARTATVFLNVLLALACIGVFQFIALALSRSEPASIVLSMLFAFATALWTYSGTLFSEVPALLFVLLSFYGLLRGANETKSSRTRAYLISGAALGCAVLAHVSAAFFIPFFFAAAIAPSILVETPEGLAPETNSIAKLIQSAELRNALLWAAGLLPMLALYAWYNLERFGSPLETGRTLAAPGSPHYGSWVDPRVGIFGLLFSGGKGLLLFNPLLIFALAFWGRLHRRLRLLSLLIAAMAITRFLFISMRSEWHGGFCLGPRHLFLLIPFLLLPLGFYLRDMSLRETSGNAREKIRAYAPAGVAAIFCIGQQCYLAFGEIFSFYHIHRRAADAKGVNIFQDHAIYLDWAHSPLLHLHELKRGPWALQFTEGNAMALAFVILCVTLLISGLTFALWRLRQIKNPRS